MYELHEMVNTMLNKKSNLTYAEVRERYEHFRSRCTNTTPKVLTGVGYEQTRGRTQVGKKATEKATTKAKAKAKAKAKTRKSSDKKPKEKGCVEPLYGKKSKCVINIVPQDTKSASFTMAKECLKWRE